MTKDDRNKKRSHKARQDKTPSAKPSAATKDPDPQPPPSSANTSATKEAPPPPREKTKKLSYQDEIKKMLFTFGDARQPNPASSELVEEIVRQHTIELATKAAAVAQDRGVRGGSGVGTKITVDDILFLIRHESSTLRRLQEFLSWKDLRKKVARAADRPADEGADMDDEEAEVVAAVAESEVPLTQEDGSASGTSGLAAGIHGTVSLADNHTMTPIAKEKRKAVAGTASSKAKMRVLWDLGEVIAEVAGEDFEEDVAAVDEEHSGRPSMDPDTIRRLKVADEVTKRMSRDNYEDYSECRQASFCYKKAKRFRDWSRFAEFDIRVADELMDVLGFIAWEHVGTLTETSLVAQYNAKEHDATDEFVSKFQKGDDAQAQEQTQGGLPVVGTSLPLENLDSALKQERVLFIPSHSNKRPVTEAHVREGVRMINFPKRRRAPYF